MRCADCTKRVLLGLLIVSAGQALGSTKLIVRDGRPVVDGVYVNGKGPYRFLVDTGSNVNLIETDLVRASGMAATFEVELRSAGGQTVVAGSDGNEISFDGVKAGGQKFLFSELNAIHTSSPDIQGVLGEWFLCGFDYVLDLSAKRMEFGSQVWEGTRDRFRIVNARPIFATSLGELALDSGVGRLVLFGTEPDRDNGGAEFRTVAGSKRVGRIYARPLLLNGRKIRTGEAIAMVDRPEEGIDGLMPLGLFHAVYICNSAGYAVFR